MPFFNFDWPKNAKNFTLNAIIEYVSFPEVYREGNDQNIKIFLCQWKNHKIWLSHWGAYFKIFRQKTCLKLYKWKKNKQYKQQCHDMKQEMQGFEILNCLAFKSERIFNSTHYHSFSSIQTLAFFAAIKLRIFSIFLRLSTTFYCTRQKSCSGIMKLWF